jgi:hypothetical protein
MPVFEFVLRVDGRADELRISDRSSLTEGEEVRLAGRRWIVDQHVEDAIGRGYVAAARFVLKRATSAEGEAAAGRAGADALPEDLVEMAVRCAWCGRFQSRSRWVDPASFPEPERTTYGMCPECFCSYSAEHFATPSAARRRYDRCVSGLSFADTVARLRPNLEGFGDLVEAVWGRRASRGRLSAAGRNVRLLRPVQRY